MTLHASYEHSLRQLHTSTTFTCTERGETSHAELRESLVTISGRDPMPLWSAMVATHGTINNASYELWPSANPVVCTFPIQCASRSGSSFGAFGYLVSIDESITSFVIEGQNALATNRSLSMVIP